MGTHTTQYGYPYPDPADDVLKGAANIGELAQSLLPLAVGYPGQPPLAGTFAQADYPNIHLKFFNYQLGTDQYGLTNMSTGFSKALIWASAVVTDFRVDVANPLIAREGLTTVSNVCWYFYRKSDGWGLSNTYVTISAVVLGV